MRSSPARGASRADLLPESEETPEKSSFRGRPLPSELVAQLANLAFELVALVDQAPPHRARVAFVEHLIAVDLALELGDPRRERASLSLERLDLGRHFFLARLNTLARWRV